MTDITDVNNQALMNNIRPSMGIPGGCRSANNAALILTLPVGNEKLLMELRELINEKCKDIAGKSLQVIIKE